MEQLNMQRPVPEHCYLRRYARDGEALFNFEPQHIAVPGDGSLEIGNAHSAVVMPELQIVTHARASPQEVLKDPTAVPRYRRESRRADQHSGLSRARAHEYRSGPCRTDSRCQRPP